MPLTSDATLIDVMFAVCTAVEAHGEQVALVGGAAATYYAPHAYQSVDCDFIFDVDADRAALRAAMGSIGFQRAAEGFFRHELIVYTVELLKGAAYIGIDTIDDFALEHRGDELLRLYHPIDVVRDRALHFWAWGDYTALSAALAVAAARASQIRFNDLASWIEREQANAPAAYDATRARVLLRDLRAALGG